MEIHLGEHMKILEYDISKVRNGMLIIKRRYKL